MINLIDLTVFVIAVEKTKNYNACLEALSKQTVSFKLEKIEDIYPMSVAFQKMIDNCITPYYIQVDEDMILNNNAIEILYNTVIKTDNKIAMVCYDLLDCHLNRKIEGVKIYKHDIFKKFPYIDTTAIEMNQLQRLKSEGYEYKIIKEIIGKHSPHWTPIMIFNRYYELMSRNLIHYSGLDYLPKELNKILFNQPNETNLCALLGSLIPLITNNTETKTKDYTKYKTKEFNIISKYLNIGNNCYSLVNKKKIVQLAKIPCANSGYELSKLLNNFSNIYSSSYILGEEYHDNNKAIPYRRFPYELLYHLNKERCIELIKEADIIHVHHDWYFEEMKDILQNKPIVTTLYNLTNSLVFENNAFNHAYIEKIKKYSKFITVSDQPLQKKLFSDLTNQCVPLVKYLFNENTSKINSLPIIIFAPTNRFNEGICSKNYNRVLEIIKNLQKTYKFEFDLIEGVAYEENLNRKRRADIIIDDMNDLVEEFHNTSIEAACFGAVPLTNYSDESYPFLKTNIHTLEQTLIKLICSKVNLKEEQYKIIKWRQTYYTPENLLVPYEELYQKCIK